MSDMLLKLVIGNTEISLQGEGSLVHDILSELRNEGLGQLSCLNTLSASHETASHPVVENVPMTNPAPSSDPPSEDVQNKQAKPRSKKRGISTKPQLIKDLNLKAHDGKIGLSDFYEQKSPQTNIHRTTVFVYYLENMLGISSISIHHLYTCYREINRIKEPENLTQNINDTASSKYGFIDQRQGVISTSVKGRNLVEHDLPASKQIKK